MIPTPKHLSLTATFLLAAAFASSAQAQSPASTPACELEPGMLALDFWVGEWDVLQDGQLVSSNRISKILGGCAVVERWRAANGSEGQSLFFRDPSTLRWKQVWVTERALSVGGTKEKLEVTEE